VPGSVDPPRVIDVEDRHSLLRSAAGTAGVPAW
jgi:hypothetical protein